MDQHYGMKKLTIENILSPDTLGIEIDIRKDEWNNYAADFLEPSLAEFVPTETRKVFEVARGAIIYGLYFYPLFALGSEQLYRTAESALKEKCKELELEHIETFKIMLDKLIKMNVIPSERKEIWNLIRLLRNSSSHPEYQTILLPRVALKTLNLVAEQINLLFNIADISLIKENLLDGTIHTEHENLNKKCRCIGIDGCKGGWIFAVLDKGTLSIHRFNSISDVIRYEETDIVLVDMPIGLQSNQKHIRPDTYARKIVRERASTIFPAPCRQAVYAETVSDAYKENERILGKKFTPLTVGIIPKIKELDSFLQHFPKYKNRLLESHPEVCFAILNSNTLLSKKSEIDGINERISILEKFIPSLTVGEVITASKQHKCAVDDVVDAICLAVVGSFVAQEKYNSIPERPISDETGLLMQMIIPKL